MHSCADYISRLSGSATPWNFCVFLGLTNDGKENVWGGKMTGGNMSWIEKRLKGICPRCQK